MEQTTVRLFRTLQNSEWACVIKCLSNPVIHFLVEDRPSSFYCHVAYVTECALTGEWYVFSRNGCALEGLRGLGKFKAFMACLREAEIPYSGWVVRQELLDAMERGGILWPAVRPKRVPLESYGHGDAEWAVRRENMAAACR